MTNELLCHAIYVGGERQGVIYDLFDGSHAGDRGVVGPLRFFGWFDIMIWDPDHRPALIYQTGGIL